MSIAIGILFFLSLIVFFYTGETYTTMEVASLWVRNYFGYFYLYLGLGCVLLLLGLALSPLGKIKLGKKDQKPEHSLWAWTAMLYSAGMGAGILLRAVQEPVFMQQNPPFVTNSGADILALEFTFYQWGFTAWAFYGLFAMVVGHTLFVRKKKVLISATIEDYLPNRTVRAAIDLLTIITTVFGLIAAIGLGTTQINGGLNHIFNPGFGIGTTLFLAALVSGIAFVSVWQGLNKGIKLISKLNIIITLLLLAFVFVHGDMGRILASFAAAGLQYVMDFIPMSIAFGRFDPGMAFLTDWTFYYWAFWLAWAPFTGIFIARISKGRTVRQLLLGVLIIPSLGTFFWFSVFGTSAFQVIEQGGGYHDEFGNVFTSLFKFLETYPYSGLLNITALLLLVGFLVTSVDSAVFVLSMFTDGGRKNPRKLHRLIWSVLILTTTLSLLLLGSSRPETDVLMAVQKLLIITSLPFAFYMIIMAVLFVWGLTKK